MAEKKRNPRAGSQAVRNAQQQLKKRVMLASMAETGNISEACRRAEIERSTHYRWMEHDEEYALQFRQAEQTAIDALEREAWRRAVEGVEEPLVSAGRLVTTVRRYSDTLLIFLLKGARPGKYRDRVDVSIDVSKMAEEVAEQYGLDKDEIMAEAMAMLEKGKTGA